MNLVDRVKNILLTPAAEWEKIKGESYTPVDLFSKYAMYLAAIPAIAGFIGYALIGVSFGFGTFRLPIGNALTWAILYYALSVAGVYVFAFVLDALAPSFGGSKDLAAAMKIAFFSATAGWVGGILFLIPSLATIGILVGIYGLYILYLGVKALKDIPADKQIGYIVVSIIANGLIVFLAQYLVRAIAFGGAMRLGL